nr:MAG TPA: RepB plasmid partitioning protein [Caudoviricetes sp.]
MSRKNLLASVTASLNAENQTQTASEARAEYTKRGASRSMIQSLDELAETSLRAMDGETVLSLDPHTLDGSFIADRIGEDETDYLELLNAIKESGQSTPITVRPHPEVSGRYMIVFGHRRARVARELGIPVRAIVKPLADIEHVIAQGQENTARANLSFIEKALFARKLFAAGMSKDVVKSALTIDDTLLSRMLSVAEVVPDDVIEALGAAKGVGRDRWEELKKAVLNPAIAQAASDLTRSDDFPQVATPDEKFHFLLNALKRIGKGNKRAKTSTEPKLWFSGDNALNVTVKKSGKTANISLSKANSGQFAEWIAENMTDLYARFIQSKQGRGE